MECLHKRRKYRQYQFLEWRTNGALQLHRLAQDELGYGKWSRCTEHVPITRPEDRLGDLDISDSEYPKLNREAMEEGVKPEVTDSRTETLATLQGSDTTTTVGAEHASGEPENTSETEAVSNSALEGQERPESYRVSMVSMEDTGQAQVVPSGPVPGSGPEANARP